MHLGHLSLLIVTYATVHLAARYPDLIQIHDMDLNRVDLTEWFALDMSRSRSLISNSTYTCSILVGVNSRDMDEFDLFSGSNQVLDLLDLKYQPILCLDDNRVRNNQYNLLCGSDHSRLQFKTAAYWSDDHLRRFDLTFKVDSDILLNISILRYLLDRDHRPGRIGIFGYRWSHGFMSGSFYGRSSYFTVGTLGANDEINFEQYVPCDPFITDWSGYYHGDRYGGLFDGMCNWLLIHRRIKLIPWSRCIAG